MEFIETIDDDNKRNVYTLKGTYITLIVSRERVYKNDEWVYKGEWNILYHNNPYSHELDGRALPITPKTLKEALRIATDYMTIFDCKC